MFLGAAGGLALSRLPGLDDTPAFAMGIGAMCVAMLRLPMTSVLLGAEGVTVMPLVIVSVVVSYVLTLRLDRHPSPSRPTSPL